MTEAQQIRLECLKLAGSHLPINYGQVGMGMPAIPTPAESIISRAQVYYEFAHGPGAIPAKRAKPRKRAR